MTMLSFRVPEEDAELAREWAERLGTDQSNLLREALRRHLAWLRSSDDVARWLHDPLTDAEASLSEIADWGPAEDWSDWADAAG